MTYCIGWKTDKEAYVIADSAVTSDYPSDRIQSSFGERHIKAKENKGLSIAEGSLKIFRWNHHALAGAGDTRLIQQFVTLMNDGLRLSLEPRRAFESAASSISGPKIPDCSTIFIGHSGGKPELLSFNATGDGKVYDNYGGVHIGSAPEPYAIISSNLIEYVCRDKSDPRARLACVLGLCQSFTVNDYVLPYGFGGTFSGLFVDDVGTHWQPDIGYVLLTPMNIHRTGDAAPISRASDNFISCGFREDVLFVNSPIGRGGITARTTAVSPDEEERLIARIESISEDFRRMSREVAVEYIVLISTQYRVIAIVHIRGHQHTRHLRIGMERIQLSSSVGQFRCDISTELGDLLLHGQDPHGRPVVQFVEFALPD